MKDLMRNMRMTIAFGSLLYKTNRTKKSFDTNGTYNKI